MHLHLDTAFASARVVTAPQSAQSAFIERAVGERQIRYTNAWADPETGDIYVGDDKGCVHWFDRDLRPRASSPPTLHGATVFGIVGTSSDLFTRDTAGNLVRWSRDDLSPVEFLATQHFAADTNPPAPSPSNAIEIVGDELWVSNARGSVSVFRIGATLTFARELHAAPVAFPERLARMPDGMVMMADVAGNLWRAAPEGDFAPFFSVGAGVVHSIAYDRISERYLSTSDICGSVVVLDREGKLVHQARITGDDVEEIVLDIEGRRGFVACFDHYIHVVDLDDNYREIGLIGPFKFQLSHLKRCGDRLLAILESGEIFLVNRSDESVLARAGGTDCVWNVEIDETTILCPTESGRILKLPYRFGENGVLELDRGMLSPTFGFGRIRKALRLPDGSMIAATTAGCVSRVTMDGAVRWQCELGGIVRDISLAPSGKSVACGTETGILAELDVDSGNIRATMTNERPIWCILHLAEREVAFGERRMVEDIATLKDDLSRLAVHDFASGTTRDLLRARGNFKRLMRRDETTLLVASNTEHYVFVFDLNEQRIVRSYRDWIINTPENACIVGNKVFAVTYSQQVLQYDLETSEVQSVEFSAEGYPKVIRPIGVERPSLLVTGRGFMSQYAIGEDAPELVRTWYLDALTAVAESSQHKQEGAGVQ